ncbi:Solute carrier family 35 member E1 -like protein [Halotydeus destructor]|nr:Solute carrier family 35 member E1 -like protein [Halotydeus destructor]
MTHSVTLTLPTSPATAASSVLYNGGDYGTGRSKFVSESTNHGHQSSSVSDVASAIGKAVVGPPSNYLFIVLLIIYYSVSVGHNILNKRLLESDLFPFPFTLTLFQLSAITFYSWAYIKLHTKKTSGFSNHTIVTISEAIGKKRNRSLILFLSLGKFLSLVFSHLSLYQVPLAFTQTVKGGLPLFVVLFSRIFLKHQNSYAVYLSLLPIVFGISLASFGSNNQDANFSWGIIFAVMSTMNLALLNVFSKKLLTTTFSAISLLHLLTKMSLMMFLPFYLITSLINHRETGYGMPNITITLPIILVIDGLMSFAQNILAFSLLSLCTPLTYSIANCSKRVAIISLSFVFFSVQNITSMSLFGIFLSLSGIFCYNIAKHIEKSRQSQPNYVKIPDHASSHVNSGYSMSV